MKTYILIVIIFSSFALFSCKKVRNCECKTTWVEYTQWGAVNKETITAYPLKDTKSNAKTECQVISTNLNIDNGENGMYTGCELK
ncbi:MAG TPA: hypothetical protein VFD77_00760 [Brumimicrobium sp.]|nr:hypothetical protein [Brumimicrobium sp.]